MLIVRKDWIVTAILFVFILSGCGLSLAEDIKPPANYREPIVEEQPVDMSAAFPLVPPDPIKGALIYAEKCLPCHGETGMGDGPQSSNLSNPAAALGRPEVARRSRPIDWFKIVTLGNIERLMPGFSSLTDRQRWDVVAYTFTLSATADELELGQEKYRQNCAECHGLSGEGDGERALSLATQPASWADQEKLASLSADDIVEVVTAGQQDHPSFVNELDEAEQYAVAAYIRSLSFATQTQPEGNLVAEQPSQSEQGQAEQSAPEQTDDEAVLEKITLFGRVQNATPGGSIPAGLKVVVTAYQGMTPAFDATGDVAADGVYRIEEVAFSTDYVYFAQVEANGLTFNSEILHGTDVTGAEVELPIQIYNTTTDTTGLRADRLHIFFDFSQAGTLQVVNLYIVSNPGSEVVMAPDAEEPVVRFSLPEGAANLQFQNGELGGRYVKTDDGFGDRMGVAPGSGQHQVLFAYSLPYNRKLSLNIPVSLPVDAVIVMIPPGDVSLKSDQLMDAGQRDVQGMAFQVYQTAATLPAGSELSLNLSGRMETTGTATGANSFNSLLIGAGILGAVLIGAGVWLYRQRASQEATEDDEEVAVDEEIVESSEALLDAIVALDDLHASGNLPKTAYQERRAELKARLAEALEREKAE